MVGLRRGASTTSSNLVGGDGVAGERLSPDAGPRALLLRAARPEVHYRRMAHLLGARVSPEAWERRMEVSIARLASSPARWRELFGQVALHAGEPSAQEIGHKHGRLALQRPCA